MDSLTTAPRVLTKRETAGIQAYPAPGRISSITKTLENLTAPVPADAITGHPINLLLPSDLLNIPAYPAPGEISSITPPSEELLMAELIGAIMDQAIKLIPSDLLLNIREYFKREPLAREAFINYAYELDKAHTFIEFAFLHHKPYIAIQLLELGLSPNIKDLAFSRSRISAAENQPEIQNELRLGYGYLFAKSVSIAAAVDKYPPPQSPAAIDGIRAEREAALTNGLTKTDLPLNRFADHLRKNHQTTVDSMTVAAAVISQAESESALPDVIKDHCRDLAAAIPYLIRFVSERLSKQPASHQKEVLFRC